MYNYFKILKKFLCNIKNKTILRISCNSNNTFLNPYNKRVDVVWIKSSILIYSYPPFFSTCPSRGYLVPLCWILLVTPDPTPGMSVSGFVALLQVITCQFSWLGFGDFGGLEMLLDRL